MQGYIIGIKSVKDEDLIVEILTNHKLYTAYRFYGMRHGTINIGFKIDFELESSLKTTISRLKDVMHLNYDWLLNSQKLYSWQKFLKLFSSHLRDVEEIDPFYFDILEDCVAKITKQNEKRVLIEAYAKILEFEGRLHSEFVCLLCEEKIENDLSLVRAFIPTHAKCTYSVPINKEKIDELFIHKSSLFLENHEVEILWNILMQGL